MPMNTIIRFLIGLLLLVLFSCKNHSDNALQAAQNDSIKKYVELAGNDTLPHDQRDQYNKKALSFIDLKRNDTVTRWYLGEISRNFVNVDDSVNYFKVSKQHYKKAVEKKDTLNLARYYRHKGVFFFNNNIYDCSYYNLKQAEKNYNTTNNKLELGITFLNQSNTQFAVNDFLEAQLSAQKASIVFNELKNERYIIKSELSLANVLGELKENKESIKKYKSLLLRLNQSNLKNLFNIKVYCLCNLGNTYGDLKNYKKEEYYYQLALKNNDLMRLNPSTYSIILSNLGYSRMNQNVSIDMPNIVFKAMNIGDSINDKPSSFRSRYVLSEYYFKKGDVLKAQRYADEALSIARQSKIPYNILNGLRQVGFVNKEKASKCIDEYDKKIDSLLNEDRKTRNQFYKIQLETNEIAQEKENAVKQKWVLASVISSLLIIVILLFVIYSQKTKQKEMKLLQEQQKANEEIYQLMFQQQSIEDEAKLKEKKRIALELHDNIMNKLASTRFNLFALSVKTDEKTIAKALEHIDKIKEIENEIRDITHELNKEVFGGSYSFNTLLEKLITDQNKLHTTSFELELDTKINWDKVSSKIKMNLYRILQEALYNIIKYAQATKVTINIVQEDGYILMAIQDNGVGFDATQSSEGIGIKNMQERAQTIRGTITLQTGPNKGTSLFVNIPI